MNIYFDTEFTGLVPNTTLISLGCVAETGEKFYADFMDYDISLCDDWICENVLVNTLVAKRVANDPDLMSGNFNEKIMEHGMDYITEHYPRENKTNALGFTYACGDTKFIKKRFEIWLSHVNPFATKRIQFVSDVCHYDFYLLCNQIFGGAFSLPKNVNPVCYDICQDLVDEHDGDIHDMFDAFNFSREEACKFYNQGRLPKGTKHNALYDAEVIKMIYEGMR